MWWPKASHSLGAALVSLTWCLGVGFAACWAMAPNKKAKAASSSSGLCLPKEMEHLHVYYDELWLA